MSAYLPSFPLSRPGKVASFTHPPAKTPNGSQRTPDMIDFPMGYQFVFKERHRVLIKEKDGFPGLLRFGLQSDEDGRNAEQFYQKLSPLQALDHRPLLHSLHRA